MAASISETATYKTSRNFFSMTMLIASGKKLDFFCHQLRRVTRRQEVDELESSIPGNSSNHYRNARAYIDRLPEFVGLINIVTHQVVEAFMIWRFNVYLFVLIEGLHELPVV